MRRRTVAAVFGVALVGTCVALAQREFPAPQTEAGKPIETRAPEKADDEPAFPSQTRAPYRPSVSVARSRLVRSATIEVGSSSGRMTAASADEGRRDEQDGDGIQLDQAGRGGQHDRHHD